MINMSERREKIMVEQISRNNVSGNNIETEGDVFYAEFMEHAK